MSQRLQDIYKRLDVPNDIEITPDRMVKILTRIYIPRETLEAAFTKYNTPALLQTIITPITPQIQEPLSDLEASTISDLDMSDSFSTTTSSSCLTDFQLDHPQESRENIYDLLSKLIEQDARRFKAEERRKQEMHVLNVAKAQLELRLQRCITPE
ncbi:hypothetical protein COEREDRAFT_89852 [Coemansia reversa NRRL 1564]|uniref:Uncharacterized protein n=1 Tax=Coemansia reversa (strain ATCC 12441 / NRRL 1564) TaxID=763665 RepID=A0A2G5B253_COERN|nr:hypothetical protein COEREDRAFT_89852 [Coemansia reversa NRRL 1564]|eukprot:PIA13100.1 hypothetical protein COEREDRAFT_89852 [Coemansia reversa NRRL 1564]